MENRFKVEERKEKKKLFSKLTNILHIIDSKFIVLVSEFLYFVCCLCTQIFVSVDYGAVLCEDVLAYRLWNQWCNAIETSKFFLREKGKCIVGRCTHFPFYFFQENCIKVLLIIVMATKEEFEIFTFTLYVSNFWSSFQSFVLFHFFLMHRIQTLF